MDGSTGGLTWDEQLVIVNGIIARYGDGAWAKSCTDFAYAASPGG